MNSERARVEEIMRKMSAGDRAGQSLVYDKNTKTLRPRWGYEDPDRTISATPSDLEMFYQDGNEVP